MISVALRRRGALAFSLVLLVSAIHVAPASAGEPALPGECPTLKPLSEVSVGDTGNGWTVERGTERERFLFEVLGIIDDGIAPGRDLVIVEVSDVLGNDMIARAGGIWAGMSGSPVYLGDALLGAVAYGFTFGPSVIGGVTPAVDMAGVLNYGATTGPATPKRIAVPTALRDQLATRAGVSAAEATTFERLPIPFSVSGLNARGRSALQDKLDQRGLSAILVPASKARRANGVTITATPAPGGNFAGVVSYGDVTLAGVGTTTYVCGDQALAFGHPLTFRGAAAFGANDANALTVVNDPTLTPFKLANVTGLFGTLDQDRLTGIRADLATTPKLRPVTSHVLNVDAGTERNGRTDVTASDWVPAVVPSHLLANADVVFDQIGKGSASVEWTINGRRANGNPWQLSYANLYASDFDITFESVFQLAEQLAIIEGNPFEAVRFTSVNIDAAYEATVKRYSIAGVRISKNGGPFRQREFLRVAPGDELRARVALRRYQGDLVNVDLVVLVSGLAEPGTSGSLLISGGADGGLFPGQNANTFGQLVNALESAPKNSDLLANLSLFSFEGEVSQTTAKQSLDSVVSGSVEIFVDVQ